MVTLYVILIHISHFIFFANDLLLFIFILDYGNDVRQKSKFECFSYLSSKCVIKQWKQLKNTFDPRTANEPAVYWWFKKFYKVDESLEDEELGDWPLEIDNDQLRAIIEADPLTTTQEVAEELNSKAFCDHAAFEAN